MANFYLDVSAVGNEYQAFSLASPVWTATTSAIPAPMDGNGKAASAASAVVAIGIIDCTGATASGTGTISVMGQNVSTTLNASGTALATAIVTAINASTAATTNTYSAALLTVQNLVFARIDPADANKVQIALRIAGTDWNAITCIAQANISPACTLTQFSGGVDGPFAYFATGSTVFGKAAHGYGLVYAVPASVTIPKLEADVIYVRTQRSASNLSVTLTSVGSINFRPPANEFRTFIFDNGTTWSGDNGVLTWSISGTASTYQYICGNTYALRLLAKSRGGLKIYYTCAATSGWMRLSGQNNTYGFEMYNVEVEEANASSAVYPLTFEINTIKTVYNACDFKHKAARALTYGLNSNVGNSHTAVNNCTFEWSGIGANVTGIVTGQPGPGYPINQIRFTNCSFVVDGGSYSLTNPVSASGWASSSPLSVSFNNCKGLLNPSAGVPASASTGVPVFIWDGSDNGRSFRYETMNYTLDWIDDGTYPYYNTQVASGSYMSQKLSWETARVGVGVSLAVGRYGAWYRDAAAAKTVTLELLVPTAEIPTKSQFAISVKYTGSDGNVYYETTQEPYGHQTAGMATALPDGVGTGSWTLNGVTGVSSKKLAVTTANAVKQNTEITAELFMCGPPASNRVIYINPDLVLS